MTIILLRKYDLFQHMTKNEDRSKQKWGYSVRRHQKSIPLLN